MFQEGPVSHEAVDAQVSHMLEVTASALCHVAAVLVEREAVHLTCLPVHVQCARAMARAASTAFAAVNDRFCRPLPQAHL